MSWLHRVAARLRGLLHREAPERDLSDEIRFHLEMQIERNLESGMAPTEARYAAMRSFGALEPMKERYRDQRSFTVVEALAMDLRYAIRTLRRSPGFTLTCVITLALAIGANTAMFSVLNAVIFRPLPYPSPDQLAMLWTEIPGQLLREGRTAYSNVERWRSQSRSFDDLAAFDPATIPLNTASGAEQISVARVTPNIFPMLGIHPVRGRPFSAAEADQRQRVALINYRFWQARFAGSDDAIGATLELDGRPSRIIGILPASFRFAQLEADVWEPHTLSPDVSPPDLRGSASWFVIGRLRPRITIDRAQQEMTALALRLDEQSPDSERNHGISVVPLSFQLTGAGSRLALWMLMGAVFCVLLIAAANVASLSLSRAVGREREISIRAALGASYPRIVRQRLAESLTLAAISGLLGLAVAIAGIHFIVAVQPWDLARLHDVSLDPRVLGCSLALCLFTGILVGLAPARIIARRNSRHSGHEGGRGIAGGAAARRVRSVLVVAQFALAIVLLAGSGLLVRSLLSVEQVDPGFRSNRVLSLQLSGPRYPSSEQLSDFYSRVLQQVEAVPGIESAGIIGDLFVGGNPEQVLTTEGAQAASERVRFRRDEVGGGFFKTLGTPLLKGRLFTSADRANSPRVVVVNDVMARRLWPGRNPVGQRFRLGTANSREPWLTIIGVVGDMRRQGPEKEPIPQFFEPLAQNPSRHVTILAQTSSADPLQAAGPIQAAVRRVDRNVPLYGVTTLDNRLGAFLAPRRFQTSMLLGFSATALLMAAIGIYGLVQYSVTTRTREIGIRIAIGAQANEILRMTLAEGMKLSLTGLVLGLAGAFSFCRVGASLLFGVTATDPVTFISVSLLLTSVAAAGCYFPARRAMKVDALIALRQD